MNINTNPGKYYEEYLFISHLVTSDVNCNPHLSLILDIHRASHTVISNII